MAKTIGVTLSEHVRAGLVVDYKLARPPHCFPEDPEEDGALIEMPTDSLVRTLCEQVLAAAEGAGEEIAAVGVALPGLVRSGVVEEAPNLPQLKGTRIQEMISSKLAEQGLHTRVYALNDADAMASGLAATRGKLD